MAEISGDLKSKTDAFHHHGANCLRKGRFEEARRLLFSAYDCATKLGSPWFSAVSQIHIGEICIEYGEYREAKDHMETAVSLLEWSGPGSGRLHCCKIGFAKAKVMNGEKDIELESLYALAFEQKLRVLKGETRRLIAEILLNIDDQHLPEAEDWIKKAIEVDDENGMRWDLGQDYAVCSELFNRKGDLSKAREMITKAIDIMKECGADGWAQKYEEELARL
ncbi:hypothetical protein ACFL0Q_02310 [Thermodesulfobacteriota bacterium]